MELNLQDFLKEDHDWELYDIAGQTVFPVYGSNGELTFECMSYITRVVDGKTEVIGFKVPKP